MPAFGVFLFVAINSLSALSGEQFNLSARARPLNAGLSIALTRQLFSNFFRNFSVRLPQ